MYLASMVLKHHENQGRQEEDLPILEWACRNLLYEAQEQLHGFLRNFPNALLAGLMRALIFPRGRIYSAPDDRLGRKVAALVSTPTQARDLLCEYTYRRLEPGNALGLLQEALLLAVALEPLEKRIRVEGVKTGRVTALDLPGRIQQAQAAGIISETEAAALREYDRKAMDLIHVDDFDPQALGTHTQSQAATRQHACSARDCRSVAHGSRCCGVGRAAALLRRPRRPLHLPGGAEDRRSARPSRVARRGRAAACPRRLSACKDPDPTPFASARGLTGSAPAGGEAAADYLDAAPRPFARIQACAAWARHDCFGSGGHSGLAMALPRLR